MIDGHLLHQARKARRLTLEQVADQVGISTSYMCDLEHNRRKVSPSSQVLVGLATTLGFTLDEMFAGPDPTTRRHLDQLDQDLTLARAQVKELLELVTHADRLTAALVARDGTAAQQHLTRYLTARRRD